MEGLAATLMQEFIVLQILQLASNTVVKQRH